MSRSRKIRGHRKTSSDVAWGLSVRWLILRRKVRPGRPYNHPVSCSGYMTCDSTDSSSCSSRTGVALQEEPQAGSAGHSLTASITHEYQPKRRRQGRSTLPCGSAFKPAHSAD